MELREKVAALIMEQERGVWHHGCAREVADAILALPEIAEALAENAELRARVAELDSDNEAMYWAMKEDR